MNTRHFYLLNWQRVGHVWVIIISFVYTELLVWAFPQSLRFNLAYCLKSSQLLAFCFLLLCIVDQTQMCPSSILPLGLFQGIIRNIERLKGWNLKPWIAGGPKLAEGPYLKGGTSNPSSYHADMILYVIFKVLFTNKLWLLKVSRLCIKHVLSITNHLNNLVLNKMNALFGISYGLQFYPIELGTFQFWK